MSNGNKATIILFDNEQSQLDVLKPDFRDSGFKVHACRSPEDFDRFLDKVHVDLFVFDVQLGLGNVYSPSSKLDDFYNGNGFDVARRLVEDHGWNWEQFFFISGYVESLAKHPEEVQDDHLYRKPLDDRYEECIETMKKVFEDRK